MCPFCLASMGMIGASATSAGGLTALAVKLSQRKNLGKGVTPDSSGRSMTGQGCGIGLAEITSERADARY
jgi:hypothetical protein